MQLSAHEKGGECWLVRPSSYWGTFLPPLISFRSRHPGTFTPISYFACHSGDALKNEAEMALVFGKITTAELVSKALVLILVTVLVKIFLRGYQVRRMFFVMRPGAMALCVCFPAQQR